MSLINAPDLPTAAANTTDAAVVQNARGATRSTTICNRKTETTPDFLPCAQLQGIQTAATAPAQTAAWNTQIDFDFVDTPELTVELWVEWGKNNMAVQLNLGVADI